MIYSHHCSKNIVKFTNANKTIGFSNKLFGVSFYYRHYDGDKWLFGMIPPNKNNP